MHARFEELKARLVEINDLESAAAVLSWDQTTYMPPGGAAARGRQLATLRRLAHEKFTDPAVGQLLDDLEAYAGQLEADSDEASLIRITRRDYERAIRVPPSYINWPWIRLVTSCSPPVQPQRCGSLTFARDPTRFTKSFDTSLCHVLVYLTLALP